MIYELRIYETIPGRLPALNDRFANHTVGFFKRHGIHVVGVLDRRHRHQQPTGLYAGV